VLAQAGVDVDAVAAHCGGNTGTYLAVLDPSGNRQFALDDMRIVAGLTPQYIRQHADLFEEASLLFIDAKPAKETLRTIMSLARQVTFRSAPTLPRRRWRTAYALTSRVSS